MRVPEGIKEIWIEREGNVNYRSRLDKDVLIIHIYKESPRTRGGNQNEDTAKAIAE